MAMKSMKLKPESKKQKITMKKTRMKDFLKMMTATTMTILLMNWTRSFTKSNLHHFPIEVKINFKKMRESHQITIIAIGLKHKEAQLKSLKLRPIVWL